MPVRICRVTPLERLKFVLSWSDSVARQRFEPVRRANPDASPCELAALWNERMYRGRVPDDVLDRALAEIRRRGEAAEPPFDK
jgi:hypothetical protein